MTLPKLEPTCYFDHSMVGLRVLLHRQNTFRPFFVPLLQEARKRWNWHIDVLCEAGNHPDYTDTISGSGKVYVLPEMEQPFAWESDEQAILDTNKRIHQAEIAAGMSLNRLALANQRDIGAAYVAPYWNVKDSAFVRKVLQDNMEPFRVARRFFRCVDDILEETAPDFILTYEWGKPFRFATWLAAAGRGIPCIAFRRSKILSDRGFWTTDPLLFNAAALEKAQRQHNSGAALSEDAKTYIENFRNQPAMVKYIQNRWQSRRGKRTTIWNREIVKGIARDLAQTARGRFRKLRSYTFWKLFEHYRTRYQDRHFQRFDEDALRAMKYIYFPMHKETDISQSFQAAAWHNQRGTIQILASSLPGGYCLLVREHRFNHGRRPSRFYRQLGALPNVIVIDPFESQFKYLKNADLVVTENGSSGWEGLMLGHRVITLAQTFYDGAALAAKVKDTNDLGGAIVDALARPAIADHAKHDQALGCMLDAERETTFSMGPDAIPAVLDELAAVFARMMDRARNKNERPDLVAGADR